jgi:hypothetical protein
MSEGVKRYFQRIEAWKSYLREQATPEGIRAARDKYEEARATLERYKTENPGAWDEYMDLSDKYSWSDEDTREEARREYENHPAWLLDSKVTEAMTRYYSLLNTSEQKDDP